MSACTCTYSSNGSDPTEPTLYKDNHGEEYMGYAGIVFRVAQRSYRSEAITEIRLEDGTVLTGKVRAFGQIGRKKTQIEDFFFAQKGDTIIYYGDEVLEVRFKD